MIIARQFGFQEIVGTEIVPDYVEITNQRLRGQEGFGMLAYDGKRLPFPNEAFTCVVSGHIIEHTSSA